jgi:hypothetical protein
MPQLLHYLAVDRNTHTNGASNGGTETSGEMRRGFLNKSKRDIDWGSLDVYTCTGSCSAAKPPVSSSASISDSDSGSKGSSSHSGYVEEYVFVQPPVSDRAPETERDEEGGAVAETKAETKAETIEETIEETKVETQAQAQAEKDQDPFKIEGGKKKGKVAAIAEDGSQS